MRYQVVTQLPEDVDHLSHILQNSIQDSEILSKSMASKPNFVIQFPEEKEEFFEMLLGFSSSVVSWHLCK